jgi:hypothetical protein
MPTPRPESRIRDADVTTAAIAVVAVAVVAIAVPARIRCITLQPTEAQRGSEQRRKTEEAGPDDPSHAAGSLIDGVFQF